MSKYRIVRITELRDGIPVNDRYMIQERFLFLFWVFVKYELTEYDARKFVDVANMKKETIQRILD